MKKSGLAVIAAAGLLAVAVPSGATAYTGPCEKQRELFEKYNIQFDMHQEQVEWLYTETCRRTG